METLKKAFLLDDDPKTDDLFETQIPIELTKYGEYYVISIDSIDWIKTENQTHAVILFEMMKDNITAYMNYTTK